MPHPDDVDVLFVDIATTAYEHVVLSFQSGELAAGVVHVVHKAQRHQRLCTAAKLRVMLTAPREWTATDDALLELAEDLERE